ncbi:MAG: flagellin, partial [Anaerolineales bacterium]
MALRINNNVASQLALRNLRETDRSQTTNLERLSTGLRINRSADDPSGLVISEQLRAQVQSLKKAVENAQSAANLINTGEAALNEVSRLLIDMRESAIFALNTGGASVEQIKAEQDSVDQAIQAIDRIATTTRFGTRNLLNGESGFDIVSQASAILDLRPISLKFDQRASQTTYTLEVTTSAEQAMLSAVGAGGAVASGGSIRLQITGNLGTEEITLASGATITTFREAVNILRGNTGVYASGSTLFSENFGSEATIRIELVGGTGAFSGAGGVLTTVGDFIDDLGVDAGASLNGAAARGLGNALSIVSPFFTGSINLAPLTPVGTYQFDIRDSGLLFQLSSQGLPTDQTIIGIPRVSSTNLGIEQRTTGGVTYGGFVRSLASGGANDMLNDPANAIRILDAAIDQISDIRAFLGAFTHDNIDPAVRELGVHIENLSASESTIRDLDFAAATAELTRNQILFQAGVSVVQQSNQLPQAVLR